MAYKTENEKRTIAALTTVGVNVLILLILIFAGAWKSPGEGPGDYPGIEVNLGYDEQGSGDIEPGTPIGNENATDVENPPAEEEKQEEVQEKIAAEEADVKPIESGTLTDPNSDVEIKEEPKKEDKPPVKTPEKKPENPVTTEKKVEKPVEKKPEEKPREADANAVYKGKTTATTPGDGDGKKGTPGNQGDDVGKEGNKGQPDGTEGAAVYKGKVGGGEGGSLEINGWNWDNVPKPAAPENEQPGRIVYIIKVNEDGELIGYNKESGSVSPAFERRCIEALQKLTFTKLPNAKVPEITNGRITFVVRAK